MRKMVLSVIMVLAMLFQTGCAQYWYQEGKTFEKAKQDRDDCIRELQKRTDMKNTAYIFEFMESCMTEKGYRLVGQGDLPVDARRIEPESSLHWRTKGLAGSID